MSLTPGKASYVRFPLVVETLVVPMAQPVAKVPAKRQTLRRLQKAKAMRLALRIQLADKAITASIRHTPGALTSPFLKQPFEAATAAFVEAVSVAVPHATQPLTAVHKAPCDRTKYPSSVTFAIYCFADIT
jgi:hypothetical protein